MKNSIVIAGGLLASVLTGSVYAQFMGEFHPFPVVAHTAGAGSPPTFWKSDVVVYNPTAHSVTVGFKFLPEGQGNSFDGTFPATRMVGANQTLLVEDVVSSMFGVFGNQKGALIVSCSPKSFAANPSDSTILAITRTYNTGSALGTFGQDVTSSLYYWNGSKELSIATGGRQDDRFRTNLGIVSFSPKSIVVWYRIRNSGGAVVAQGQETIQPYSMGQWGLSSLGVANQPGALTAEFWLDPDDVTPDPCSAPDRVNVFVAYLSKVDGNPNGTGDGEHLYAVPTVVPGVPLTCPGFPYAGGP